MGSKTKGKKVAVKAVGAKAPKAKRATASKKVAPKYRDPANPANTWTGRGRMPQWVQALNAAGTLASAQIPAAE
jgi:DNA-binding protein H-NS